ncbi:MAG TPA: VWA domain-containing protein [Pyrinomonadaceae bacterium]|jgi:VWFA-related protein
MRFFRTKVLLLVVLALLAGDASAQSQATPQATPATAATESQPLVYGLVVDNSGSFRAVLDDIIEAARTVVAGNNASDETFVIRFVDSDNVQLLQDFTRNRGALSRAMDNMFIQGGQTAITDALYVAAEHLAKRDAGDNNKGMRRVLVLITDGEDRGSTYKPDQLIALLREQKIQVHVLGFPAFVKKERGKKVYEKALAYLNTLAQETGGRVFLAENPTQLTDRAAELLNALHAKP